MPRSWRHVLFWGGLRGAIALTLAISLPAALGPERETVIQMTFGVVLFSIIVQGFSMDRLLKRLEVITLSEGQAEYERRNARALAERAGFDQIKRLSESGFISKHTWDFLKPILEERLEALTSAVQEALRTVPDIEAQELSTARREMLRAQRGMLGTLRRDGVISDRTFEDLIVEVDAALESGLDVWKAHTSEARALKDICQLLMVVVQERDLESATNALAAHGIPITRIRSSGGFLRQANHLVLVGLPEGKVDEAVEVLQRTCRSRVEYVSSPFGGIPFEIGSALEVKVRGATVFVFDVERCEVF